MSLLKTVPGPQRAQTVADADLARRDHRRLATHPRAASIAAITASSSGVTVGRKRATTSPS